jgi:hypothetical protein
MRSVYVRFVDALGEVRDRHTGEGQARQGRRERGVPIADRTGRRSASTRATEDADRSKIGQRRPSSVWLSDDL